jgi:LuxR family maltose regulon positive regulatory protein
MPGPLLETKLYVPKVRRQVVSRPRLIGKLAGATEAKLTLVSAPAGFGKTTLLMDWIAATPPEVASIAWLSLDEGDNEPGTFWTYVITALGRVAPVMGADAGAYLQSGQPAAVQTVLSTLINELSNSDHDVVLVLDDYHVIRLAEIHEAMSFLLDHLPPALHLVIASRADPPLPLPRLRARGELVELRSADLRFRTDEAEMYFNGVMELGLTPGDIDALEGRTEGWIAALRLAALSLSGREDASSFIETFTGDNRYIVDYLVEEVLQRQPEAVRSFLLQTAILDRLTGGLCDAVTGQQDGEKMLRSFEQSNLFVVPLDDRRSWYRYHHLFADVLRAHLIDEGPGILHEGHRRASLWFERNDDTPEAIRHALAATDFERAAALVEMALPEMLRSRREATLRSWLEALPDSVVRLRPVLCAGYVGVLLHRGDLQAVPARLDDAEQYLETASPAGQADADAADGAVYVDEAQFRELPGMIALYRAGSAQVTGNLADAVRYARRAIELMPEEQPLRGGALALLGLALWSSGDIEGAHKTYAEGIARVHRGGYVNDSSTIMLADMRVAQGRLREASAYYERALRRADGQGKAAPIGVADLHVGISEIYREQGDLAAATEHLTRSRDLGELAGLPENQYRWFTAMASVMQAQNDFDGALELLDEASRLFAVSFSPDVRPIPALRARLWLRQGRLVEAEAWTRDQGLQADNGLGYLREFDHFSLARLLIARGDPESCQAAETLLGRLLEAAEAGGRGGSAIEALALRALARQSMADVGGGMGDLQRAVSLAESEGYARVFLDEGPAMATLLNQLAKAGDGGYARRILAAARHDDSKAGRSEGSQEPLSGRAVEGGRLLRTDLSGPEIARELVVSLNTVRTHTKNIYTKLGVNTRRAAVRRAEELDLL